MRILLVDDEPPLLTLLSQYLVRSGHETIVADSLAQGREMIERHGAMLDAAIIDLTLPDGNGEELVRELVATHASVKIVIATGYPYEPPKSLAARVLVLQKPFLPRQLLNVLG